MKSETKVFDSHIFFEKLLWHVVQKGVKNAVWTYFSSLFRDVSVDWWSVLFRTTKRTPLTHKNTDILLQKRISDRERVNISKLAFTRAKSIPRMAAIALANQNIQRLVSTLYSGIVSLKIHLYNRLILQQQHLNMYS